MIIKWKLIGAMSVFGGSGASGATSNAPGAGFADWAAGCTGVSSTTQIGLTAFLEFGKPKLAVASGGGAGVYAVVFDQAAILGGPQYQANGAQFGATFPSNVTGAALPMITFDGSTFDSDFTYIAFPIPLAAVEQIVPGAQFRGPTGPGNPGISFEIFDGQLWEFVLFKNGVPADPQGHFTIAMFTVGELGTNI